MVFGFLGDAPHVSAFIFRKLAKILMGPIVKSPSNRKLSLFFVKRNVIYIFNQINERVFLYSFAIPLYIPRRNTPWNRKDFKKEDKKAL